MMSKLADQFPAVDLDELKRLANGEEDYPDEGLSSQDTSLQGNKLYTLSSAHALKQRLNLIRPVE